MGFSRQGSWRGLPFPSPSLVLGAHPSPEGPAQPLPSCPLTLTWAVEDLRERGETFGREGTQGTVDTAEVLGVREETLQAPLGFSSSPCNKDRGGRGPGLTDQAAMAGRGRGVSPESAPATRTSPCNKDRGGRGARVNRPGCNGGAGQGG